MRMKTQINKEQLIPTKLSVAYKQYFIAAILCCALRLQHLHNSEYSLDCTYFDITQSTTNICKCMTISSH